EGPQDAWTTGSAGLETDHGKPEAQDPGRLPSLPPRDPSRDVDGTAQGLNPRGKTHPYRGLGSPRGKAADGRESPSFYDRSDERYLKCHRLESRMIGNDPVRFGGGRRKRSLMATAPTAHPTRQTTKIGAGARDFPGSPRGSDAPTATASVDPR